MTKLLECDLYMNELLRKVLDKEATAEEMMFLWNIMKDIDEVLGEAGICF